MDVAPAHLKQWQQIRALRVCWSTASQVESRALSPLFTILVLQLLLPTDATMLFVYKRRLMPFQFSVGVGGFLVSSSLYFTIKVKSKRLLFSSHSRSQYCNNTYRKKKVVRIGLHPASADRKGAREQLTIVHRKSFVFDSSRQRKIKVEHPSIHNANRFFIKIYYY